MEDKEIKEVVEGKVFEFPNGEYVTLDYKDGKLIAGGVTNAGLTPQYKMEYDNDFDIDKNLNDFYALITEQNADLLNENKSLTERNWKKQVPIDIAEKFRKSLNTSSDFMEEPLDAVNDLLNYIVSEYPDSIDEVEYIRADLSNISKTDREDDKFIDYEEYGEEESEETVGEFFDSVLNSIYNLCDDLGLFIPTNGMFDESCKKNVRKSKRALKEKLTEKDINIIDWLGIEDENYSEEELRDIVNQFNQLSKNHYYGNIWLKGDVGVYVDGKIVEETKDLVALKSNIHEIKQNLKNEDLDKSLKEDFEADDTYVIDEVGIDANTIKDEVIKGDIYGHDSKSKYNDVVKFKITKNPTDIKIVFIKDIFNKKEREQVKQMLLDNIKTNFSYLLESCKTKKIGGGKARRKVMKEELDTETMTEVEEELIDILKEHPQTHNFDVEREDIKEYVKKRLKEKGYEVEISGNDLRKPMTYHIEYFKKTLKEAKSNKDELTIEEMFNSVGVKNVFDDNGYFTPEALKKYNKVGEKFFDDLDEFDKLCEEENCFKNN